MFRPPVITTIIATQAEDDRALGFGAEKKLRFVPLTEFCPDEKQTHELRDARARSHAEVTAAVVGSGAVPVRELASIVTDYALKRQLRHFVAFVFEPTTPNERLFLREPLEKTDMERVVAVAPDFIRPGDIVHLSGLSDGTGDDSETPVQRREAVLLGTSSFLFTESGATDTLQEVSDELAKMGLTFDALDEAGMYHLRHDKRLEPWQQKIRWSIWSPARLFCLSLPEDAPDTHIVSDLEANGGASIERRLVEMTWIRRPKKDTRI